MKYIITENQYEILKEQTEEVLKLPSIDYFGGWDEMQSYIERKGNPSYSIDGNLYLGNTPIKSLGNLTSVGGYLDLSNTSVESLGNLNSVGGYLDLRNTSVESLGNLTSVGGDLDLRNTSVESLGNLTSVGGYLDLRNILAFKKYSIKEIEKMVNVEGKIFI